jgi:hypothetical protein
VFNYIKWELKSIYRKYTKVLIAMAIIMGLMGVIPLEENAITEAISFAFVITMMILMLSTYVLGTKKVLDTFRKPTFLLESMISIPTSKLLLAKYILAIIINVICSILFVVGICVILARAESLIEILEFLNIKIDFEVIEVLVTLLISSTFFTSTVTLCFVWLKSMFPKLKGSLFFGALVWYFAVSFFMGILSELNIESIWVLNFIELLIIGLSYFCTVHLIENKLEIYN